MYPFRVHPDYPGFPNPLEEIYVGLHECVIELHVRWRMYGQLFLGDATTIDILNRTAPGFFLALKSILLDDIVLSVTRLTDPSSMSKRQNLVLAQLIDQVDRRVYASLINELNALLDDVKEKCKPFRKIRNRLVAHLDLDTAISTAPSPRTAVTEKRIEDALESIRKYMNKFKIHFTGYQTEFEDTVLLDDAMSLIDALQRAER